MKEPMLEKINLELSNGIDTEPKTLYLLAEIRKYIDRCSIKERNKYPNLYFYCNWVLHIKMDRTPAKRILDKFGSLFSNIKNLEDMSKIFKEQEKDFYSFVYLKDELLHFLKAKNLPTELIKNNRNWYKFKKLLVEILIDCPLTNECGRVSEFYYERDSKGQIQFRIGVNDIRRLGSFRVILKEK